MPQICWRDYICWEHLGIPQEELESFASEVEAWSTVLSLLPLRSATLLFQFSLPVSDMIHFTVFINIFLIKKHDVLNVMLNIRLM